MAAQPSIPEKPYFKIGEVARLAGVEPYVLRYWETEFKAIKPEKTRSNQRMYRRRDVETVLAIKKLLYEEGYRIDGAKRRLRELGGASAIAADPPPAPAAAGVAPEVVERLRSELRELEKIIDDDERS